MKVLETSNVIKISEKEIHKVISHILIKKDGAIGTEKISLKLATSQGGTSKKIFESFPVKVAAEFTTHAEGHYLDKDAGSEVLLFVGENGGIYLGNDEYLQLSLENMAAAKNYQIFAIESPVASEICKVFEKININQSQESKRQTTGDAHTLIVHNSIVAVELQYINGSIIRFGAEELKAMSTYQNDIVANTQAGIVYGSREVYTINLNGVVAYEIFTDGTAQLFYTVSSR